MVRPCCSSAISRRPHERPAGRTPGATGDASGAGPRRRLLEPSVVVGPDDRACSPHGGCSVPPGLRADRRGDAGALPILRRARGLPGGLDRRAGRRFLGASADVSVDGRTRLWVTAQGRFADVRERPVGLRPGVGPRAELGARTPRPAARPRVCLLEERGAEALVAFGPPSRPRSARAPAAGARGAGIRAGRRLLDRLADAIARDPERFTRLVERRGRGRQASTMVWRRLAALLRGRRFEPSHDSRESARLTLARTALASPAGAAGAVNLGVLAPAAVPGRRRRPSVSILIPARDEEATIGAAWPRRARAAG